MTRSQDCEAEFDEFYRWSAHKVIHLSTPPPATSPSSASTTDAGLPPSTPGTPVTMGYANIESPGFSTAVRATHRAASPNAGNAAAAFAGNQLVGCQKPVSSGQPAGHWKVVADAGWPKVLSSATADGTDWFVVAPEGALTWCKRSNAAPPGDHS